jgi:hypothetical protein
VHWDLRESMRETDVEVILQRAKEKYLEAKPRIIIRSLRYLNGGTLSPVPTEAGH